MAYSVIYVWPDGRREVRYTRPSSDQRLADEIRRMQERLGTNCPYRIESDGSDPNWSVPPCETCEGNCEVENDFGSIVTCPDCAGLVYIEPAHPDLETE